jgi:hypothetical protein
VAEQGLGPPTAEEAQALAELIDAESSASDAARDLAVALKAVPESLNTQFLAEAAYVSETYRIKVTSAHRAGLATRSDEDLDRIAAEGSGLVRLLAASDRGWHYQAFTDPGLSRLIGCLAVAKRDIAFGAAQ